MTEDEQIAAAPAVTGRVADIDYDEEGYALTGEGQASKQWHSGQPARNDADVAWFEHFREEAEQKRLLAESEYQQEAAAARGWGDYSYDVDPAPQTAEEEAEERWITGESPADRDKARREAPDRWEREPWSEAEEAAAARLGEALTHAEQVRTAYTAAQAAERAAPDRSIAQAEARVATRAAKEAQFYADLEVMDAREKFRWLRRAYSAPPTWLAAASPDERDAHDALVTAPLTTPAQPETEQREAWLRYLADEEPANDAEVRWFETFRESNRRAHAQHGKEHQAWQRFTQGEPPQDHAETEWFTYWEERSAFQRYAQGKEPRDEADRQRFARFEQELAAYGEPGREALDPGERQPWNQAEQATSGTAGLTGQHHQHGHQAQEQPDGMLHDGPETAGIGEPAGRGADHQPTAADPAEPEQAGRAPVAPQRHEQGFLAPNGAGASSPGQFAGSRRESAAPSRPWRESADATWDIHRQRQADPEADFEAGS